MSAKENRLLLQTSRPKKFRIEYLERITQQFSEGQIIGRGGFGTVYKGKKDNGEFIAVKKLNQTEIAQIDDTQFKKEVLNVMHISHPNIVRVEGYCISKDEELITHEGTHIFAENQYKLICFEYLPSGNLDAYLNNEDKCRVPNWNERYNIIKGICKGLHYLHEGRGGEHILHLDLKPANVLLDKNMIPKIADFGQSRLRLLNEGQIHTAKLVGTRGYMPIEYIKQGTISKKTDIYSLGVIVMEIIAGERKYPADQLDEVREKWKETSREEYEQIEKCIKLALYCMEEEPEKRLDMKQVIDILGISEDDMNHHPDGIEEHSSEVQEGRGGSTMTADKKGAPQHLHRMHPHRHPPSVPGHGVTRSTMPADEKGSPPEIPKRTLWRRMIPPVCGVPMVSFFIGAVLYVVVMLLVMIYIVPSYEMRRPISITVEEASFTRFALATSSPVLTYNLSAMVGIYSPSLWRIPKVTKPLEAAFFFGGQRLHVMRFGNNGQFVVTTFISMGPLSGNVTLDTAGVAEYRRKEASTGSLFEVELVVMGQVMYDYPFTICNVQATCPFKLRHALPEGTTELLELFERVKCPLRRKCTGY